MRMQHAAARIQGCGHPPLSSWQAAGPAPASGGAEAAQIGLVLPPALAQPLALEDLADRGYVRPKGKGYELRPENL